MTYLAQLHAAHHLVWWVAIIGGFICLFAGGGAFRYWGKKAAFNHVYFAVATLCAIFLTGVADWSVFGGTYLVLLPLATWLACACLGYLLSFVTDYIENKAFAVALLGVVLVAFYFAAKHGLLKALAGL